MTITFNKDELVTFMQKVDQWYNERDRYLIQHFPDSPFMDRRTLSENIVRLRDRFAKDNPKPNWRDLL